jgi:uncharacterized protein HemX
MANRHTIVTIPGFPAYRTEIYNFTGSAAVQWQPHQSSMKNNRSESGSRAGSRLKALTAAALESDKGATGAKEQARLAKAKLKAAKKQMRDSKWAYKAARKLARKAVKEAKRARKALQRQLDRLAKTKKKQSSRTRRSKPPIQVARPPTPESKHERTEIAGSSG